MTDQTPENDVTRQAAEEMTHIPYEPLLPAEKWLISASLALGAALLGLLLWLSAVYFPMPAK